MSLSRSIEQLEARLVIILAQEVELPEAELAFKDALSAVKEHGAVGAHGRERLVGYWNARDRVHRLREAVKHRHSVRTLLEQQRIHHQHLRDVGIDPDAPDAEARYRRWQMKRGIRTPASSQPTASGGGLISIRTKGTAHRAPRHFGPDVPGKVRPGQGKR